MKTDSANDHYPRALSFPAFVSGGNGDDDVSVLKRAVARLFLTRSRHATPSFPMACREAAARPIIEAMVVSPYKVDDYGRPRTLSRLEILLHAMAWPVVIAVVIGYGLAISFTVIHNPSTLQLREKIAQSQLASQELEP